VKRLLAIGLAAGLVILGFPGCLPSQHATVDAPQLASALRWLGICAVLCSALAGTALVLASRNHRR